MLLFSHQLYAFLYHHFCTFLEYRLHVEQASMKDWHYYRDPLRVYSPDFDILVSYFNQVYPIIDASDNTEEIDLMYALIIGLRKITGLK